jgi:hypothetical protein
MSFSPYEMPAEIAVPSTIELVRLTAITPDVIKEPGCVGPQKRAFRNRPHGDAIADGASSALVDEA